MLFDHIDIDLIKPIADIAIIDFTSNALDLVYAVDHIDIFAAVFDPNVDVADWSDFAIVLSDNNVAVVGELHGAVSDLDVDFITATVDYDFNAADSKFYVHSELNNVAVVADFTPVVFADFSSADFAIVDADIHTPLIQDIQQPSLDDVCLLQQN